jgi:hypothetical protein
MLTISHIGKQLKNLDKAKKIRPVIGRPYFHLLI